MSLDQHTDLEDEEPTELPDCNSEGYLIELTDWTPQVAGKFAQLEGVVLTDAHWTVLHFLREFYQQYQHTPPMRLLVKAMQQKSIMLGSGELQQLFPGGFFKQASRIAGLPKPTRCT